MAKLAYTVTFTSPGESFDEEEQEFLTRCKSDLQKALSEMIPFSNTVVVGMSDELIEEPVEEQLELPLEPELSAEEQEVVDKFEEGSEEIQEAAQQSQEDALAPMVEAMEEIANSLEDPVDQIGYVIAHAADQPEQSTTGEVKKDSGQ